MPIDQYGHSQFARRITEIESRVRASGKPEATAFLTLAQQRQIESLCSVPFYFEGGRQSAQRCVAVIGSESPAQSDDAADNTAEIDLQNKSDDRKADPDWMDPAWYAQWESSMWDQNWQQQDQQETSSKMANENQSVSKEQIIPVTVLRAALDPRYDPLEHKDVLGALMHSGIEREVIGDIAVEQDWVWIVCQSHMAEYIKSSVLRIKRQSIQFEDASGSEMPPCRFESVLVNVSSLRSDAITSALSRCSRTQAEEKIRQGFVKVNDEVLESNRLLKEKDVISVRKAGKYQLAGIRNKTRKDRLVVEFLKFV